MYSKILLKLPKMIVTEEDKKFIKDSKSIIQRAKDFKLLSKQLSVRIDDLPVDSDQDDTLELMTIFLNALDKVMEA